LWTSGLRPAWADDVALNVLTPLPPDPAPPGAAKFSEEAFAKWRRQRRQGDLRRRRLAGAA
jgi:hypothetical protein